MKHSVFIILLILISQYKAISSYQIDQNHQDLLNNSSVINIISSEDINTDINFNSVKPDTEREKKYKRTKGLNTFSGKVYMGDNLLPKGSIFLIENIKGNFVTNSFYEIKNGVFEFNELKSGSYILYVIPNCDYDFLYYPKYLPTYSGNSYKWENSVEKDILSSLFDFSIYLKSYSDPFYGHEKIFGSIVYHVSYRGERDIPVPVILLNQSREPMDFRIANSSTGEFGFNYLPAGTYYLHIEIPGIKSEDYKVIIKEKNNTNYNINFYINNGFITAESYNDNELEVVLNGKYLKLILDENINFPVVCELINMSGSSVSKNIYMSNEVYINTSSISAGIYILRVRTYDNIPVKTKKVYIDNI